MTAVVEETPTEVEALRAHFIAVVDEALSSLGERALVPWNDAADALLDARSALTGFDQE